MSDQSHGHPHILIVLPSFLRREQDDEEEKTDNFMSLFNLPFEEIIQVGYHLSTKKQTVLYSIYYLRLVGTL